MYGCKVSGLCLCARCLLWPASLHQRITNACHPFDIHASLPQQVLVCALALVATAVLNTNTRRMVRNAWLPAVPEAVPPSYPPCSPEELVEKVTLVVTVKDTCGQVRLNPAHIHCAHVGMLSPATVATTLQDACNCASHSPCDEVMDCRI
jgi:hypothetical protein